MVRRCLFAAALLLVGCPRPAADDDDAIGDDDDAVDGDCPELTFDCTGAPVLSGGFDTVSWDWTWSDDCSSSIGPMLTFEVPDDIVSLALTVDTADFWTGFALLSVGGEVWIDWTEQTGPNWEELPLWHYPTVAGSAVLPMDDSTYPNPGCMAVLPVVDYDDVSGMQGELTIVSRLAGVTDPAVDLNLVILDGAGITEDQVDEALDVMDELWTDQDAAAVGMVTVEVVDHESGFVSSEGADINELRASYDGAEGSMTVFFIADFLDEPGTLGIASGIPGPMGVHGTMGSGLVLSVDSHRDFDDTIDTTLLGETMTHELGHQFGLFHTSEAEGLYHDGIADTPECTTELDANGDGWVDADECADHGGDNVMFWTSTDAFRQDRLTPVQADVFYFSPVMR